MTDMEKLINLSIAFGNTPRAKLGSIAQRDLMKIYDDLNLDHIDVLI
jgi:hypothetical protein